MPDPELLAQRLEARNLRALQAAAARDGWQALRALARARAFTLLAVLTLGLGIGACTAVYALAHAVVLRALPFPQPRQLVAVLETSPRVPVQGLSWPDYLDWKADNHVFSQLAALRGTNMLLDHLAQPQPGDSGAPAGLSGAAPQGSRLAAHGQAAFRQTAASGLRAAAGRPSPAPIMVIGSRVSANYFDTLGIAPELGRTFTPAEASGDAGDAVVVSDAFYRSRLGADPHWLGRALDLDGKARTVVGVMPPGFPGVDPPAAAPQFWTPLGAFAAHEGAALMQPRGAHSILLLGRLRPGATLAQARADLAALTAALARQYPATNAGVGARLQPYLDFLVGDTRAYLLPLLAAAALLLLVACASVANLLLASAAARRREAAIRRALGAPAAALLRLHAAEGLWLGLGGCALGLALATLALRALPATVLTALPRGNTVALGAPVLAAACALGLLSALAFALAPYGQTRRAHLLLAAPPGARLRTVLLVGEVALAALLLVGTALLGRSMLRLNRVDLGFRPRGVLTFIVGLADPRYATVPRQQAYFRQAVDRLARLPGVDAAGGVFPLPLIGYDNETALLIVGAPRPAPGHEPSAHAFLVRGRYFAALGIPRLRGRLFTDADRPGTANVALVDSVFARRYLNGADPVGRQLRLDGALRTIVGEVAHVQDTGVAAPPAPQVYVPHAQDPGHVAALSFVLHTRRGGALALRPAATAAMAALDPDQALTDLASMSSRVAASTAAQREMLQLVGLFAALALIVALVGVYGLVSYTVVQRTRDIGIRMALGSPRRRVVGAVLGRALALAAAGAAVGLLLALWLGGLVASLLFGVSPRDPATLAAVPALLLPAAALAALLPAWRAARTDPNLVLRAE